MQTPARMLRSVLMISVRVCFSSSTISPCPELVCQLDKPLCNEMAGCAKSMASSPSLVRIFLPQLLVDAVFR